MVAAQKCQGIRDTGNEAADSKAKAPDIDAAGSGFGKVFTQTIGLVVGLGELLGGDVEADVAKVVNRREPVVRNLVDVEGELRLHVGMCILAVGNHRAIFRGQFGKLDGHRVVGSDGVSYVVADVMGQSPNGEGELVSILGIAKEVNDKVAGAHVVGQVGDELVAEGIVANILNDAACIGVRASLLPVVPA